MLKRRDKYTMLDLLTRIKAKAVFDVLANKAASIIIFCSFLISLLWLFSPTDNSDYPTCRKTPSFRAGSVKKTRALETISRIAKEKI